jgi:hypothetical protein
VRMVRKPYDRMVRKPYERMVRNSGPYERMVRNSGPYKTKRVGFIRAPGVPPPTLPPASHGAEERERRRCGGVL